jgi:hypothetical protein
MAPYTILGVTLTQLALVARGVHAIRFIPCSSAPLQPVPRPLLFGVLPGEGSSASPSSRARITLGRIPQSRRAGPAPRQARAPVLAAMQPEWEVSGAPLGVPSLGVEPEGARRRVLARAVKAQSQEQRVLLVRRPRGTRAPVVPRAAAQAEPRAVAQAGLRAVARAGLRAVAQAGPRAVAQAEPRAVARAV